MTTQERVQQEDPMDDILNKMQKLTVMEKECPQVIDHFEMDSLRLFFKNAKPQEHFQIQEVLREQNANIEAKNEKRSKKHQKPLNRMTKGFLIDFLYREVTYSGVKALLEHLSTDTKAALLEPAGIDHGSNNPNRPVVLNKRLRELLNPEPAKYLKKYFASDKTFLRQMCQDFEITASKSTSAKELRTLIMTKIEDLGLEVFLNQFSVAQLKQVSRYQNLHYKTQAPGKATYVYTVRTGCFPEVVEKKVAKVKISKKKPKRIDEDVTYDNLVYYFTVEEMSYHCKKKRMLRTGTRQELARRITEYYHGDRAATLVTEERRKMRRAERLGEEIDSADDVDSDYERKVKEKKKNKKKNAAARKKAAEKKKAEAKKAKEAEKKAAAKKAKDAKKKGAAKKAEEAAEDHEDSEDSDADMEADPDQSVEFDVDNLEAAKLEDLKLYCENENIEVDGKTKQDYIKAIEAAVESGEEDGSDEELELDEEAINSAGKEKLKEFVTLLEGPEEILEGSSKAIRKWLLEQLEEEDDEEPESASMEG